jgi:hypothetical protein
MAFETPSYIKSLLIPNGKKPVGRKVWSLDLQTVWLPFFTATNAVGDTQLPPDTIGAPIRLALEQDGTVRFSKSGRPVTRVVKPLSDAIRLVRENFAAGLTSYAERIAQENVEAYTLQLDMAKQAGEPILVENAEKLAKAQSDVMEKAMAEATQARRKGRKVEDREPVGVTS